MYYVGVIDGRCLIILDTVIHAQVFTKNTIFLVLDLDLVLVMFLSFLFVCFF